MKNKQRQLILLSLVLLLIFSNLTPLAANSNYSFANSYGNFTVKKTYIGFADVPSNAWFFPGIQTAFELDLMKGTSFSTFNPNDTLSVAEAVTLAVRLYEIYYNYPITDSAASNPWYQKYIDAAINSNILNPDYFKDYTAPINRTDFASLYVRLFPFEENEIINQLVLQNIPDIDDGMILANDIITMYNYGIMTGDQNLQFYPKSNISRAEVATIISRLADPKSRKSITPQPVIAEKHVERPYEWFCDQNQTGQYSHENCGPAVTSMILKWDNQNNDISAEYLRSQILPNGGWWYTDDIEKVMSDHNVPYQKFQFFDIKQITDALEQDRIVLICVDGYYFSEYYNQKKSGHFMIIKGYTNQNGIIRFETYNPDSRKNHYYFADNIKKAADIWWQYFYIIGN